MVEKSGEITIGEGAQAVGTGAEKGSLSWSPVEEEVPEFYCDDHVAARLSSCPVMEGDTVLGLKFGDLSSLNREDFMDTVLATKRPAAVLKKGTGVQRVALVATGDSQLRLLPLHGLSAEWKPVTNTEEEYNAQYPGYIHSKNGPRQPADALETVRLSIIADNKAPAMDYTFYGAANDKNLFARIIRGELDQRRVWESSTHVAFLTPFANTPGFTVLVPRRHLSSDILALSDSDLYGLADAIHQVSQLLESSLGLKRVGVIFEGFEIDYAHAKLIPIYPNEEPSNTATPSVDAYSLTYTGFVTSKPGPRVPSRTLLSLSQKLEISSSTKATRPTTMIDDIMWTC